MNTRSELFYYNVFGIPVQSTVPLPAFNAVEQDEPVENPIMVTEGKVGMDFENPPTTIKPFTRYNEDEFYYEMPDVARYFVTGGNRVVIERLCEDWDRILLFFYSNCIAAALFQRHLIPMHVSGVIGKDGKVWLFAAISKAGKSTTALMLSERGYPIFTDDTALLEVTDHSIKAVSSYPMIKAWADTLENQTAWQPEKVFQIRPDIKKYGIMFHETFEDKAMDVAGIIFLDNTGVEIKIEKLEPMRAFELFRNNVYRRNWAHGMNREQTVFKLLSQAISKLQLWKAVRPKNSLSFDSFSDSIVAEIIAPNES